MNNNAGNNNAGNKTTTTKTVKVKVDDTVETVTSPYVTPQTLVRLVLGDSDISYTNHHGLVSANYIAAARSTIDRIDKAYRAKHLHSPVLRGKVNYSRLEHDGLVESVRKDIIGMLDDKTRATDVLRRRVVHQLETMPAVDKLLDKLVKSYKGGVIQFTQLRKLLKVSGSNAMMRNAFEGVGKKGGKNITLQYNNCLTAVELVKLLMIVGKVGADKAAPIIEQLETASSTVEFAPTEAPAAKQVSTHGDIDEAL